jgi:hypothetical protein
MKIREIFAGVVVTGDKLSPVSWTPVIKGSMTPRFSTSGFFHESFSPVLMSNPSEPFQIFIQILVDIHGFVFITSVNDTTDKLFTGAVSTTPIN